MNCSENMKPPNKRRGTYWADLVVGFLVGLAVAALIGLAVWKITGTVEAIQEPAQEPPSKSTTAIPPNTVTTTPPPVESPTNEPETLFLGPCRITAFCACEKCCGKWALNRPNGIVYGAAGVPLEAGVSCASPWPFGTVVEIEGLGEYIVQDRPAQWVIDKFGENQFDIYFDNHEAACEFGLQYINVTVKEEVT